MFLHTIIRIFIIFFKSLINQEAQMEQKQKLSIQTREEFNKESYRGWNFEEEQKAVNKGRLESEIKSLKNEIERKQEELRLIRTATYKEYQIIVSARKCVSPINIVHINHGTGRTDTVTNYL